MFDRRAPSALLTSFAAALSQMALGSLVFFAIFGCAKAPPTPSMPIENQTAVAPLRPLSCPSFPRTLFAPDRFVLASDPCRSRGTLLLTFANHQILYLCKDHQTVASYEVSVGQHGFGKTAEGDNRTPVGTYTLRSPEPSPNFGTRIYINYPNPDQRRSGYLGEDGKTYAYTGGDVLIHGPPKSEAILARFLENLPGPMRDLAARMIKSIGFTSVNWTAGCLAVETMKEMEEIAAFARSNPGIKLTVIDDRPGCGMEGI